MNASFDPVRIAQPGLARPRQLVRPEDLAALLDQSPQALLIEVGNEQGAAFRHAHIAGAAYLDIGNLEADRFYNKVADNALLQVLLSQGVRYDTTVILYGRSMLAAARAAHLMLYAGVADVRLLDGAFATWRLAGLPCADGTGRKPVPVPAFCAPFPGCPHFMVDMAQAAARLAQPGAVLVSVRTWNEFSGVTSGYSYIHPRGEIPGARWGRAGREADVNSMSEYQLPNGRMRDPAEIAAMWRASGIHAGLDTAFYCGTGWRASLAFFQAWLMGWERIAVYDGGWYEWSASPRNPIVCRVTESLSA